MAWMKDSPKLSGTHGMQAKGKRVNVQSAALEAALGARGLYGPAAPGVGPAAGPVSQTMAARS